MLPTKGLFQDIECPYFDNKCNRPYCHFRHRRKPNEIPEEPIEQPIAPVPDPPLDTIPTYKPTPKSELLANKSHIPISYVPDLASYSTASNRKTRPLPNFDYNSHTTTKPTYKPTPLSILSSANQPTTTIDAIEPEIRDQFRTIQQIKIDIANVEYNPAVSLQDDINFESLEAEFDLIDTIIEEPLETKENYEKGDTAKTDTKSRGHRSKSDIRGDGGKSNSRGDGGISDSRGDGGKSDSKGDKGKSDIRGDGGKKTEKRSSSSHKSKHRRKSSDDKRHEHKSRHKSEHRKRSSSHKHKPKPPKIDDIIMDSEEDDDTLLECYKIFNEYKAPEAKPEKAEEPSGDDEKNNDLCAKKRIAHSSSNSQFDQLAKVIVKPKTIPSAGQAMAHRLKVAQAEQMKKTNKRPMVADVEPKSAKIVKVTAPLPRQLAQATPSKPPTLDTNIIDTILKPTKPKKIAPVLNANSIQRAKAKIDEIAKRKAMQTMQKTPAQITKHTKRIAHIPDLSLSDIPDVLHASKSKLPINVRTRFLTMLADETIKLYMQRDDAYTRALNEELSCYEKCKVLATYKNSAMLAVSRLRKELQERDKNGLGPITSSESSNPSNMDEVKALQFYEQVSSYVLSDEELALHGYPLSGPVAGQAVIKNRRNRVVAQHLDENQRQCSRCGRIYAVDAFGFVVRSEECQYHPLKKRTFRGESNYLCCKSNYDVGCTTAGTHVCEMGEEAELGGYQTTMAPTGDGDRRSYAVYALDCEMCYTVKGLELTRVTIVDAECKTVYESLVKPLNPIVDYNTNFSGITREQMERVSTSILQVQANILHLCNSKTILIGHSLESDMKALKIIHGTIIDTAVLFPHKMGLPHKRALRVLASEFLKRIIQNNVCGHDSAEDAITCMDLVKWKLKEEMKVKGIK